MSHEIRTPLTAIIGYADLSLQADQSMQERVHALQTIHRSGTHLLRIINDVLDLSKIEAKKLEVEKTQCSLFELINDVKALTQMKASEKGLAFVVNYRYPVPTHIETDPLRLKQILVNLCGNAIKFTEQGHVHVNVDYDRINEQLTIEVSDTGIGLTAEEMVLLFQEFQQADAQIQRKYGGTGLGLALSQHLAKLLGGKISFSSKKGIGSNFALKLAQRFDQKCQAASQDRALLAASSMQNNYPSTHSELRFNGKVLLAEDTDDLRVLITMYLRRAGVSVVTAENGAQAIERILEEPFDLVLMDIQMPEMNGLMAMHELQRRAYAVPVVAVTANAMKNDQEAYRTAGFADFLAKPIEPEQLVRVLNKFLTRTAPQQNEDEAPIASTVTDDDAVIRRVVNNFVEKLPSYHANLLRAIELSDWVVARDIVHNLKGLGGTMGYPQVTKLAAAMYFQIEANNVQGMQQLNARLGVLVERIQQGAKPRAIRLAHSASGPMT